MHKFQLKEQFLLNQPLKEFQKISPSKLFFRPKIATNETHTGRSTFCQSLLSSDLNLSKKLVLLKQIFDRYQSEDIVEQLSKAIVQLLSDSGPPIELLVKKDYIELLLEFISVGYKEHIISSSAWALSKIISNSPKNACRLVKANGIKILVNAIQPDLEISIDAVILALANLIKDNNQYKSDIITHNILDVLTRVSENFREEIYSSISYFLMGLANNEYKFRISHLAQIVYLLERIIVCKITEVQVYCLWTIAEITSIAEHVPVIIQSDLIKNTVDFLKCGEMKLISPAFRIIKQIGAGNFTAMKYLEFEEWHPEATTKYEPAKTPKESLDFDDLLSIMSDELLIKHSLIKTRASSTLFNLINWDNEAKLKTISMGIFRIIFKIFEIDDDDIFQTKILEVCVNLLEIFENKQYSNPIAILFIQTGCFDGLKNLCKRMASIKQLCNKIGQRFFGVNDILNDVPMVIKELSWEIKEKTKKRKGRHKKNKTVDPSCMSVDEVLRFINNEDKKSKSNKSEKPYSNKNDENINSIDKEVEEFRERIESCAIKCERLKPKVTQEWLEKLKKSILGSRTK